MDIVPKKYDVCYAGLSNQGCQPSKPNLVKVRSVSISKYQPKKNPQDILNHPKSNIDTKNDGLFKCISGFWVSSQKKFSGE